jgi:Sulfotransferase domain
MENFQIDFIGIGFAKSGTTTVANLLEEHPEICMSIPKEVQYFNITRSFYHKPIENSNYEKGSQWYKNHWAHQKSERLRGEISPQYIQSITSLERIKKDQPQAKILIFLRNPADIAFSFYGMAVHHHQVKLPHFSEAISTNEHIRERMFLFEKVKDCINLFSKNQIHFFILEEFMKDREAAIKSLYKFLGVDIQFKPPSLNLVFNAAGSSKFNWLRLFEKKLVATLSGLGFTAFIKTLKNWSVTQKIQQLNTRKHKNPELTMEDRKYIYEQVKNDVEMLETIVGRDLSFWLKMKI